MPGGGGWVAGGGLNLPAYKETDSSAVSLVRDRNRLNPWDKSRPSRSRQSLALSSLVPLTSSLMPFTGPKDPVVHLNGLTGMAKGRL